MGICRGCCRRSADDRHHDQGGGHRPQSRLDGNYSAWSTDWGCCNSTPNHEIKATLSIYFFLGGIFTVIAHLAGGIITSEVTSLFVWTGPTALIGVWSGALLYGRFRTEGYLRLVLIALLGMGVMMLVSGLRG